ncbi:hypothetical protein SCALIN_C25_0017 [Candidatus Scalindua japonica]|uniref:DUF2442 domain-containing protein n=1 Tax=Candidatus Scalindua japonica TaxID=1284222 RepID=A0A286U0A5_9BACT|nr:DUF2442 domain-containing protein [Candidatus Scalindua japonica]GAX61570.1 hypothetical protein SCALIN_C25_0017 [Candidatus Scalindua japonica]
MSTLTFEASAKKVWFDNENMWVSLIDGRQLSIPLVYFPRLLNATPEQRCKYEMSGGGTGLHWEEIDEDISVPGLLLGYKDLTYYKNKI